MTNSIITGTGSYIPTVKVPNKHFLGNDFYDADGIKIAKANVDIVNKLQEITCIRERRYVEDDLNTSDISFLAAESALDGTDRENLDYIIVAQNFGDVKINNIRFEMVPKNKLFLSNVLDYQSKNRSHTFFFLKIRQFIDPLWFLQLLYRQTELSILLNLAKMTKSPHNQRHSRHETPL
jgi:hypothetical protein